MFRRRNRSNMSPRISTVETLESRHLMATFGTPWPEPRTLSVSFPSDQAAIGAFRNQARESLDQVADRSEWQEAALRAFQTWSIHANINVGLVPDRGDDFGTVGLSNDDPRFGEFRIGAFPQSGVLANALPFQQLAGTWSGDVLINSDVPYFLAPLPATSPVQVPVAADGSPAVELNSVLLHEAGNALGLADNSVAGAVMNGTYSGPNMTLKSSDITAIRQLYGARRDVYETVSNNARSRATVIPTPTGFRGDVPLTIRGSLNSMTDVDFYRFQPLAGREKVTVRLMASGISLVKAQLEVLDRFGNKIADAKADSIFENNLQLEIGSLKDHSQLFLRVVRNTGDVFAIGDYRIELDYRDPSLQPSIVPPPHDQDAIDEDDTPVDFVSVDVLFSQVGMVETEVGANDTLTTASPLFSAPGFLANTRYEAQASIASLQDRDLWRFQAPSNVSPLLNISVDPVGLTSSAAEVILLNTAGDRIPANATRRPDGGVTLEVVNPAPNQTYILFVRTLEGQMRPVGNYVVAINFATNAADQLRPVFSGTAASNTVQATAFTTYKTQLFQFSLNASAASSDIGVQLSLYDARTGDIVASFATSSGVLRREYVWLGAGDYYWRIQRIVRTASAIGSVSYTLAADVLSDDQGPRSVDPNQPSTPFPDWETSTPSSVPLSSIRTILPSRILGIRITS
jgi:hypothetical protein